MNEITSLVLLAFLLPLYALELYKALDNKEFLLAFGWIVCLATISMAFAGFLVAMNS